MKNILTGMGQSNVLVNNGIKQVLDILDRRPIKLREYFTLIADVYLEHGNFDNDEQKKLFDYKNWNTFPGWWEDDAESMMEIYQRFDNIQNWKSLKKRHMIYIPYGLAYEYKIQLANPEWFRTTGEDDYLGKVDFIDYENKKLITVKTGKNIKMDVLAKQIKNYWKDREESDFEIILIAMDTTTWNAYSGPIYYKPMRIEKEKPKSFDEILEEMLEKAREEENE